MSIYYVTATRSVEDIDLFVGTLHEAPVRGGIVGPVFAYLIGKQFKHLREGDRLFFDTEGSQAGFTKGRQTFWFLAFLSILCFYAFGVRPKKL